MTTTIAKSAGRFKLGIDVKLLVDTLNCVEDGGTISYQELHNAIGRTPSTYEVTSARRIAARDSQVYFEAIHKVGLRRLPDGEKVRAADALPQKMRRMTTRTLRKITSVDYDALTPGQKLQHNIGASYCGIVLHITKPSEVKKIAGEVTSTHGILPPTSLLDVFRPMVA